MAKTVIALVIAASVLLALFLLLRKDKPAPPPPQIPVECGSISGVVTDGATLEPIIGANVQLVGYRRGAICDTAGRFRIDSVTVGHHNIRAAALAYEIKQFDSVSVSVGKSTELTIQLVPCITTLGTVIRCCSDSAWLFLDSLNAMDSSTSGR